MLPTHRERQTFTPSRPQLLKQAASPGFRPLRRIKPGESAFSRDPAATPSPAFRPWCSSHHRRLRLLQALTALFHAAGTHGVTNRPDSPSTAPLPGPDSAQSLPGVSLQGLPSRAAGLRIPAPSTRFRPLITQDETPKTSIPRNKRPAPRGLAREGDCRLPKRPADPQGF